ncbi:apolipoprotein N-acyltransferase [Nocardioides sp. T2.26MG-1]|uniref:apolipoprotein N-acyltransferase n=1 Tax=Nocardioides sp. T2.26MG-1 TaxID=3041166 RepID=UPI002540D02E|nr:apolipoprotein N-acyltransferase [Nocardioides sp. T2.26MG-1]
MAGALLSSAFQPVGWSYLAPVSVALLVWASSCPAQPRLHAWAAGYLFGFAFLSVHTWWLYSSMGAAAWLLLAAAQGWWFALFAACARRLRSMRGWPLWIAANWASIEIVRTRWPFGGMPWGQLGFAAVDSIWSSALPYLSVVGVSFLTVLIGCLLVQATERGGRDPKSWVWSLIAFTLGATPAVFPIRLEATGSLSVAVVQGEVPGDGTQVAANHRAVTRSLARATEALAEEIGQGSVSPPDLILWPENSTAVDIDTDRTAQDQLRRAMAAIDAPLLLGSVEDGPTAATAYNQASIWLRSERTSQVYTKAHPVPFGEWIPFRKVLGNLNERLDAISRDMVPGSESKQPMELNSLQIGTAICFDIAYAEPLSSQIRNGADLVVVQTSNAMFLNTAQPAQQLEITRARAVETGRDVIVSSVNGISAHISSSGAVKNQLPSRTSGAMVVSASTHSEETPAVRMSRTLPFVMVLVALAAIYWRTANRLLTYRKGRKSDARLIREAVVEQGPSRHGDETDHGRHGQRGGDQ